MPQPYIYSFAHIPTVRSKFPQVDGATLSKEEFDFIVVGGGPSGCALATRFYERTEGKASVLLVEAGMHPEESPELNNCVPQILQTRALHRSAFDYAYPTQHEDEISGSNRGRRELVLNSGKVLGGSTCINFGIWTKGAMADYDLWASLVGSDEFSWAKMGPFFDRIASLAAAPSKSPIRTRLISQSPRLHYWSSIARRGLEESGFAPLDINGGLREVDGSGPGEIGSGQAEGEGKRQAAKDVFGEMTECIGGSDSRQQVRSTALRYFEDVIDPLYSQQAAGGDEKKKEKFEVWTSLRVESVVFEGKKAVGVKTRFGIVRARREVILCGGAIQSPYILLSSGVGPASHLASRGIPLVHDSPGVGRNLWEHPFVDVRAKLRPAHRKNTVETFASLMTSAPHLHQWATQRTGLMSGLLYEWLAYSNMHSELSPLFSPSPSSPALITLTATDTHVLLRTNVPHIEHFIHYGHGLAPAPDPMASSYVAVTTVLLVPRSRGYVEIPPSTDPNPIAPDGRNEKPHIVVNQLKDPIDRYALRNAVRRAYAILGAPAWREYLEDVSEKGDAELDDIIERGVATLWHYGGTCTMKASDPAAGGPTTLADGVVDTQFRVEGVEGLRVADTSVIPFPVSGHTQAVAYAIGEKMAELLAREYNF
ncbi:GMC oxidoreductase family protein [Pleurotus pulmonarius]